MARFKGWPDAGRAPAEAVSARSSFPPRVGTDGRRLGFLLAGCLAGAAWVHGEEGLPEARVAGTPALRPGVATVVRFAGRNLAETRRLWTSWGGWLERNDAEGWEVEDGILKVPVQVPADYPAGLECVRVLGTKGVSGPVLVWVDGLSPGEPPGVAGADVRVLEGGRLPMALEGTLAEGKSAVWMLRLTADQRVSLEVVSLRIGSPADPVLRMLDPRGRELAKANGTPGLGGDCALEFRAGEAGDYCVEVRDAEFGGGPGHRFRLRLGNFPLALFPEWGAGALAGRRPGLVTWHSGLGDRQGEARILEPRTDSGGPGPDWVRWVVNGEDGAHAVTRRFPRTQPVPARESEPNGTPALANEVGEGVWVHGNFGVANDRDILGFEVTRPGRWKWEVAGRSLDWPVDPLMRLLDAGGRELAKAPAGELDASLSYRFDGPGTYRLELEEAAGRFGPGRSYLVRGTEGVAGFRISADTDRVSVPVGGTRSLKINLDSQGYDGPVRFELSGLGEGWSLGNTVSEARKKEWTLEIRCAAGSSPGIWQRAALTARAEKVGENGPARLELTPALRKAFPRMLAWAPGLTDELWIGSVAPEPGKTPRTGDK